MSTTRTYLMSMENVKTFCQGALGAMTFGAYHMYVTNDKIEMNNRQMKLEHRCEMDKLVSDNIYKIDKIVSDNRYEMDKLHEEINNMRLEMNKKRGWFW